MQKHWKAKPYWADVLAIMAHDIISIYEQMENPSRPNIVQHILMMYVLPQIHVALMKLLITFLCCVKGKLEKHKIILFCAISCTLKWSAKFRTAGLKFPYRCTRELAYTCLQKLVMKLKKLTNYETVDLDIILEIQEDLWKKKKSPNLPGEGKNASQQTSPTELDVLGIDEKLFIKALQTLHSLITSIPLLQSSVYKMVTQMVRSLLKTVPKAVENKTIPSFCNVDNWRENIFQLVLALHGNPHVGVNAQEEFPLDKITIGLYGLYPCELNFENFSISSWATSPKPQSSQSTISDSLGKMSLFDKLAMIKEDPTSNLHPSLHHKSVEKTTGFQQESVSTPKRQTIKKKIKKVCTTEMHANKKKARKENQGTSDSKVLIKSQEMAQICQNQLDFSQNNAEQDTEPERSQKTVHPELESMPIPKSPTLNKKSRNKSKPSVEFTDFQFQVHKYELRPLSIDRLLIKGRNFPSTESTCSDSEEK